MKQKDKKEEVSPLAPPVLRVSDRASAPSSPLEHSATPLTVAQPLPQAFPEGWKMVPLGDVLTRITYGFTNPMPDAKNGPWKLTAKDIIDGKINYETARKTTQADYDELTDKSKPCTGDVLLTKDGSIGRVAVVDRSYICINQSVALLQVKPIILPYYLLYVLSEPGYQKKMESDSDGSTIKHIYITRVNKMEIPLPPISDQKKFLCIIKTLDDKIALNRATNQTLEQIAQALFTSWFVDFDPVHAKASGEQPLGMDAASAALFPDSFEESELGMIPKGWEWKSLYELADYLNGAAFREPDFTDERFGLPVVKIAELKQGITNSTKYSNKIIDDKYIIHDGDILYSWSGSPETSLDIFKWYGGYGLLNQHIFKLSFTHPEEEPFVYSVFQYLKSELIVIAKHKQTTGLGHVTIGDMKKLMVAYPGKNIVERFYQGISGVYFKHSQLIQESFEFAIIRDSLLPKLLSGEISVADVAEQVVNL
jgi:type I restriction enzyme S subunit